MFFFFYHTKRENVRQVNEHAKILLNHYVLVVFSFCWRVVFASSSLLARAEAASQRSDFHKPT